MMHTEEEARKCWCPQMPGEPWDFKGGIANTCMASQCMAWRWEMRVTPIQHQPKHEWCEEPTGRGYCGLVATPTTLGEE